MPAFEVRFLDPGADAVTTRMESAASEQLALECVSREGRVILGLRQLRPALPFARTSDAKLDVPWWCRELGTLLRAGMTIVEAVETLQAQAGSGRRQELHNQLLARLQQGMPMSRAMESTAAFPVVLIASVIAGERSSSLAEALEDFLRYDEMLQRMRRQLVSAAIYPTIVVALGALIAGFLLIHVIPRFARFYAEYSGPVSLATETVLALSDALRAHWPLLVGAALALVMGSIWAWRTGAGPRALRAAVIRVKPLEAQWAHFSHAKLYHALALMTRGGYTLDESLAVCGEGGFSLAGQEPVRVARAEIARGRSVVAAFSASGLADPVSARLLSVGERGGAFHIVLHAIAERHAMAFGTFVERASKFVEPLLLLAVALVVGGIILMMYMPIFDIASSVR